MDQDHAIPTPEAAPNDRADAGVAAKRSHHRKPDAGAAPRPRGRPRKAGDASGNAGAGAAPKRTRGQNRGKDSGRDAARLADARAGGDAGTAAAPGRPRKLGAAAPAAEPASAAGKTPGALDLTEADLTELIGGIYDGLAQATHWPGWRVEPVEARAIARPLSRILERNAALAQTVSRVADPAALIIASLTITLPRIAAYRFALAQAQLAQAQAAQAARQPPYGYGGPMTSENGAAPPPTGAANGATNGATVGTVQGAGWAARFADQ